MGKQFYDPRFDGKWPIVKATTFTKIDYNGTMDIYPLPNDGHGIAWNTSVGKYSGIGLVIDGQLYLAFGTEMAYGLAVYSPKAGGGIESVFSGEGMNGAVGRETVPGCEGWSHLDKTYDMQGWQPPNTTYKGQLAFVPYGPLFLMRWVFQGTSGQYVGVGMVRNGRLLTCYGLQADFTFGCGLYNLNPDGSLSGEWAIPSYQATTVELYGQKFTEVR